MSSVFLGHPGPYGDIIVCAPIAKDYADRGFKVYWPIRVEYLDLVSRFDYVTPIPLPEIKLVNQFGDREDKNMSDILMGQSICKEMNSTYLHVGDRFVDGVTPFATPRLATETIEEKKYRIAEVDFSKKYELVWRRDKQKEDELYNIVVSKEPYVFAHLDQSDGSTAALPDKELNVVKCEPIEGYNILDWYKIIIQASTIYCIESSLQCFVDGVGDKIEDNKKFLLSKADVFTTNSENWNKIYNGFN
jgi:hypothetical protein